MKKTIFSSIAILSIFAFVVVMTTSNENPKTDDKMGGCKVDFCVCCEVAQDEEFYIHEINGSNVWGPFFGYQLDRNGCTTNGIFNATAGTGYYVSRMCNGDTIKTYFTACPCISQYTVDTIKCCPSNVHPKMKNN